MAAKRKRNPKPRPTYKGKPVHAIMKVKKGENIAGMWVSDAVPQIGIYKLIAKKKTDGTCEWAHFVQRANGTKDKVYRGTVDGEAQLPSVVQAINNALKTAYGPGVQLHIADADFGYVDNLGLANPSDQVH